MRILEKQVDALMRLCTAEEESEKEQVRNELRQLLSQQEIPQDCSDPEYLARELLLELGVPEHLGGHPFAVQAIVLVAQNRSYIDNITFGLYPQLATKFDSTPARVERSIRHLIEVTWARGDLEVLAHFFGNSITSKRGKPTNGEFLARMANIVKLRMQEAA